MTPLRIQRRRTRGWKMPANTVSVTRPGKWGNPFLAGAPSGVFPAGMGHRGAAETLIPSLSPAQAVALFGTLIAGVLTPEMYPAGHAWLRRFNGHHPGTTPEREAPYALGGKHLACWCALCPAHRDGKPLGTDCTDCAPCHADVLLALAAGFTCEAA